MDLAEARARTSGGRAAESRHPWETARLDVVDRLIAAHVRLAPDSTVLDVGCGDTFVAEQLSARYPGATFCAVDTAFTDDLVAAYRLRLAGTRVELYASLDEMPAPPQPVALVLLMDVIEHIADPCGFLRGLLARPYIDRHTRFLITVPAFQSLFSAHDTFLGHYRRYSSALLRQHAAASGLDVDEVGYFFFSLLPLRLAQVLKERLAAGGPPAATTGLVTWGGGRASAEMLRRVLVCDASVALWLKRIGIIVPGLSNFAVCRKSA
jgi:hypothetical protein